MLDFILKFLALGASDKVGDEFSKARDNVYSIRGFSKSSYFIFDILSFMQIYIFLADGI